MPPCLRQGAADSKAYAIPPTPFYVAGGWLLVERFRVGPHWGPAMAMATWRSRNVLVSLGEGLGWYLGSLGVMLGLLGLSKAVFNALGLCGFCSKPFGSSWQLFGRSVGPLVGSSGGF